MTNIDSPQKSYSEEIKMPSVKPVLITGSPRSGTTWVGRMIAVSPKVAYVEEPFRINHRPGVSKASFDNWFPYITIENESRYINDVESTMSLYYNLWGELKTVRSIGAFSRTINEAADFLSARYLRHATPLIKDPIAVFSAPWLANRFDMNVLILIRHPLAFVGSIKRLNWKFSFSQFLNQPMLMRDYLFPFERQMIEFENSEVDIVEQGILFWRCVYYVVSQYREKFPQWIFKRHEDISRDPIAEFSDIFNRLGLEFDARARSLIDEYSNSRNSKSAPQGVVHLLKRDSRSTIDNWRQILSNAETAQIRKKTMIFASCFIVHLSYR